MSASSERRDYWNERYASSGLVWGTGANQFVAAELDGLSPRRVLDLGCGQGRNAIWLATQGHTVTGVDISDVAISQARDLAAEAGVDVEFIASDLATWQPAGEYDLVVLSYIQVPPETRHRVHRLAVDALAPGGRVFVIAHHRSNLDQGVGGPQSAEVLYDEELLSADFSSLHIVRNETVVRHVDKDGVVGDAIDVLLVAEKPVPEGE